MRPGSSERTAVLTLTFLAWIVSLTNYFLLDGALGPLPILISGALAFRALHSRDDIDIPRSPF